MARHERPPAPRGEPGRARRFWYVVARCWAWLWSLWTFFVLFVAIPEWIGLEPASTQDIEDGIVISVFSVAVTGTAWLAVYALNRVDDLTLTFRHPDLASFPPPRVRVEKRHRLPRPGSVARQPMRQLSEAEAALAELLRRLSDVQGEPAHHLVERTWHVATDTAASLRSVAARLEAVELAAKHAPVGKRGALNEAAGDLRRHLDQGLDAYRGLIAAAGLLAANAPVEVTDELIEATEGLAGLAEALRELSGQDKNDYRP